VRIEDYALIGDLQTSALVGCNGSVDWLCLPRFDSASCFTALLGEEKHGRWVIAPAGEVRSVSRRYRDGTLILETDFETADGAARVIDFMPRPVLRGVRRRPQPAGRQLPAGIHPPRPDQRRQGPQRRADRDTIHPTRAAAAHADASRPAPRKLRRP
jgi:Domain of unknown function (DUF5911)